MSDRVNVWKMRINEDGAWSVIWVNYDRGSLPPFVGWRVKEWVDSSGDKCIFMAPVDVDDETFAAGAEWSARASEIPY